MFPEKCPFKIVRGDGLLPTNPVATVFYLQAKDPKFARTIVCMVNTFNDLAKAQCQGSWAEL